MAALFKWLAQHAAAFTVAEMVSRFPELPQVQHLNITTALTRRPLPQTTLVRGAPGTG